MPEAALRSDVSVRMLPLAQSVLRGVQKIWPFPEYQSEYAEKLGFRVHRRFDGRYILSAKTGQLNTQVIEAIVPSFIAHRDAVFDEPAMRQMLAFLHQPIRVLAAQLAKPKDGPHVHETAMRTLIYATTGTLPMPACDHCPAPSLRAGFGEVAGGSAHQNCDHDALEESVRDAARLRHTPDFGTYTIGGVRSFLPLTFNPARGIVMSRTAPTLKRAGLDAWLAEQNFPAAANSVLPVQKLEQLVRALAANDVVPRLLDEYAFDHAVGESLIGVRNKARSLKAAHSNLDLAARLRDVRTSLDLVHDVVGAPALQRLWRQNHVMQRHDAPMPDMLRALKVMQHTLDALSTHPLTLTHLDALALEFQGTLAFSTQVLRAANIPGAGQICAQPGTIPVTQARQALPKAQQQVLKLIEQSVGAGRSALTNSIVALGSSAGNFILDMARFLKGSPLWAAASLGFAAYLMTKNWGLGAAVSCEFQVAGGMTLDPTTGLPMPVAIDQNLNRGGPNFHYDLGMFGLYKHYTYDYLITDPARATFRWLGDAGSAAFSALGFAPASPSQFIKAAYEQVCPVGNAFFTANFYQDLAHGALWGFLLGSGYQYGLRGGARILRNFDPLTNMAFGALARVSDITGRGSRATLRAHLQRVKTNLGPVDVATAEQLSDLVEARAQVPDQPLFNKRIRVAHPLLRQEFTLTAQAVPQMQAALQQFDTLLGYAASGIGAQNLKYQKHLRAMIGRMTTALNTYSQTQDSVALARAVDRDLRAVMAAEQYHLGQAKVFQAAFDRATASHEQQALARIGSAQAGRVQRGFELKDLRTTIQTPDQRLAARARAAWDFSCLSIGHALIGAARAVQTGFCAIPRKAQILGAVTLAGALAATLEMSGISAQFAGPYAGFVHEVAARFGQVLSTSLVGAASLVWNTAQDIVQNHVLMGGSTFITGAAAGAVATSAVYLARAGARRFTYI